MGGFIVWHDSKPRPWIQIPAQSFPLSFLLFGGPLYSGIPRDPLRLLLSAGPSVP